MNTNADSTAPAIGIENIEHRYRKRKRQQHRARKHSAAQSKPASHITSDDDGSHALRGVTFAVKRGSMVALLGPNGSGKSTLMRIISGLLTPSAGCITIDGAAVTSRARAKIGIVFQSPGLDPFMTVRENLTAAARLYGLSRAACTERIDAMLEQFDLTARAADGVRTLSGGLARRVDLCRALLHQPSVLLLDEPTVGLDPRARRQFLDCVQQQRDSQHMTIMMSTHLTDEAETADRVIMLDRGRIVADDAPYALRASLGSMQLLVEAGTDADTKTNAGPPLEVTDSKALQDWQRINGRWRLLMNTSGRDADLHTTVQRLIAEQRSFTFAPPTLDDVFFERTGHSLTATEDAPLARPHATEIEA